MGFGDPPFGGGIVAIAIVGHGTPTPRRERPSHTSDDGAVAAAA